mmetsp:Transcript_38612/g.121693  ORF Transcript_38612/g.121693 Transcript_38612/m.121693 type:complete len:217 (-) Transcript_38612:146-796(-)
MTPESALPHCDLHRGQKSCVLKQPSLEREMAVCALAAALAACGGASGAVSTSKARTRCWNALVAWPSLGSLSGWMMRARLRYALRCAANGVARVIAAPSRDNTPSGLPASPSSSTWRARRVASSSASPPPPPPPAEEPASADVPPPSDFSASLRLCISSSRVLIDRSQGRPRDASALRNSAALSVVGLRPSGKACLSPASQSCSRRTRSSFSPAPD